MNALQAIVTKYLPPGAVKGSRYKATCYGGSITVGKDYALGIEENHAAVAKALIKKMKWHGRYFMGGAIDGNGYVFVSDDASAITVEKKEGR